MSLKFKKGRAVDFAYHAIPILYTGIKHPTNAAKELVLIDDLGKHSVAAYRNMKTDKVGIHFLIKNIEGGFVFKDKKILFKKLKSGGWVI